MSLPSDFYPQLSSDRLSVIAKLLLDVHYEAQQEISGPLDCAYTRGAVTFGRCRNAIIQLCQSGEHDSWLALTSPGMDFTFTIGSVPCRVFGDDPDNPRKPGFFKRNPSDQMFPATPGHPEVFRFVIDRGSEGEEAEAYFIGYDAAQNEACRWSLSTSVPTFAAVDGALPEAVDLPPADARPRAPECDSSQDSVADDEG